MFLKTIIAVSLALPLISKADVTGKVFVKSDRSKPVLTYVRNDVVKDGIITATASYKNPDGSVALNEVTVYDANFKFKSYQLDHKQLNYSALVNYDGKKVTFNMTKDGKKQSPETESRDKPVIVGAILTLFLKNNWQKLMDGKDVEFRLAVADRQETIGFEFEKVKDRTYDGKSYTSFKMSPSSWLISKIVDDIYLMFDENKNLKVYEGRITPKIKKDGKWADLDATVFY